MQEVSESRVIVGLDQIRDLIRVLEQLHRVIDYFDEKQGLPLGILESHSESKYVLEDVKRHLGDIHSLPETKYEAAKDIHRNLCEEFVEIAKKNKGVKKIADFPEKDRVDKIFALLGFIENEYLKTEAG